LSYDLLRFSLLFRRFVIERTAVLFFPFTRKAKFAASRPPFFPPFPYTTLLPPLTRIQPTAAPFAKRSARPLPTFPTHQHKTQSPARRPNLEESTLAYSSNGSGGGPFFSPSLECAAGFYSTHSFLALLTFFFYFFSLSPNRAAGFTLAPRSSSACFFSFASHFFRQVLTALRVFILTHPCPCLC
jgi:hypothetical protein